MNRTRAILLASVAAAALLGGGVVGATAASSPTPSPPASSALAFHSNENPSHEAGESPAREQAENNGTFHPGGTGFNGGHPCGGKSNEDPTHEKSETAAQEAAENAACPAPAAGPTATR